MLAIAVLILVGAFICFFTVYLPIKEGGWVGALAAFVFIAVAVYTATGSPG